MYKENCDKCGKRMTNATYIELTDWRRNPRPSYKTVDLCCKCFDKIKKILKKTDGNV